MRRVGRVALKIAVSTLMSGRDITFYLRNGFDSNVVRLPDDGLFLAVGNLNFSSAADGYIAFFEGGQSTTLANIEHGIKHTAGGVIRIVENGVEHTNDLVTYTTGTNYDLVIAYRNNEAQYFWRETADDIFALLWVSSFTTAVTDVYAEATNTGVWSTGIENFGRMPETSLAPATEDAGAVAESATDNAPDGDSLFEFGITTLPSSGSVKLRVRKQDNSNYWEIEYDNSGNYNLNEIVGGTPATRISGVAVLSGGEIGQLRLSGNEAKLYYDKTALTTYATARNFLRETAWELDSLGTGGAISDLRVYKTHRQTETGVGPELMNDGDMEAADTSAWSVASNATLSKETTNPYGGARVLRVARNGIDNPSGFQQPSTAEKLLQVTGVTRSDGNAISRLISTAIWWIGTTSTDWQPFDITFITPIGYVSLSSQTSTGTEYTEWDNLSAKEIQFNPDSLNNQLVDVIEE